MHRSITSVWNLPTLLGKLFQGLILERKNKIKKGFWILMWITSGYGGSDWGLLTSSVAIEVAACEEVPKLAQYYQPTQKKCKL